jgi:hypothetical protein
MYKQKGLDGRGIRTPGHTLRRCCLSHLAIPSSQTARGSYNSPWRFLHTDGNGLGGPRSWMIRRGGTISWLASLPSGLAKNILTAVQKVVKSFTSCAFACCLNAHRFAPFGVKVFRTRGGFPDLANRGTAFNFGHQTSQNYSPDTQQKKPIFTCRGVAAPNGKALAEGRQSRKTLGVLSRALPLFIYTSNPYAPEKTTTSGAMAATAELSAISSRLSIIFFITRARKAIFLKILRAFCFFLLPSGLCGLLCDGFSTGRRQSLGTNCPALCTAL